MAAKPLVKPKSALPNLFTLANAGVGLLAISKGIDALAGDPALFERRLETACWLIFLAMVFDALDGRLARLTSTSSDFGAQLDSLADALTFGVAPALLAKVLLEHEEFLHPRLHFFGAAVFVLMAILRLARFNLETGHEEEAHAHFAGLPSPAAAGTVTAAILMCLSLGGSIEFGNGEPTPLGKGLGIVPLEAREALATGVLGLIAVLLPVLGLLMVSRVRYRHLGTLLSVRRPRGLVVIVIVVLLLYLAPVPFLFFFGLGYVGRGLLRRPLANLRHARMRRAERRAG